MKEWKHVCLLTVVGALFRVAHYLLFSNDFVAGNDLVNNILLGQKFSRGDYFGFLDIYWTPLHPFLIGILTYFIDSVSAPSIIISIFAGSLVVPLTYVLVRQSYGKTEATIAAAIAIFYAHLTNAVFEMGTENIYLVWIIGALIIGWKGIRENSVLYLFVTGLAIGLAYLTRPEAFGYIVFFSVAVLGKELWQSKRLSKTAISQVLVLTLGFLILASPYILYLRGETGSWTISGKMARNFAEGQLVDEDSDESSPDVATANKSKIILKTLINGLVYSQTIFYYLFPLLLVLLVGIGLFGNAWGFERFTRETFLITFCAITLVGYAVSVLQTRYFYILLPIAFGWMAKGIVGLREWFCESTGDRLPVRLRFLRDLRVFAIICLAFIYLYTLPLNYFARPLDSKWDANAYEERDAGLWLKENGKNGARIFCPSKRPAFYSEGDHLGPVSEDPLKVYQDLELHNVDYVVLTERALKRRPFLRDFDKRLLSDPKFELVYQRNEFPGYEVTIFKRK